MSYNRFTLTKKKGIDDLKSTYPYANAHDWPNWNPAFPDVTKESYEADVEGYEKRVKEWNENYVNELKGKGEYGEPYTITFNFKSNPDFDSF